MQDIYLKFNDENHAREQLVDAGVLRAVDEQGEVSFYCNSQFVIDYIGTIFKPTGNMITVNNGDDVFEMPEHAPIDGWHINIRCLSEVPQLLEQYRQHPSTPSRVWA